MSAKREDRNYESKQCKITKDQKRMLIEFVRANFKYSRGIFKLNDEAQNKDMLWETIALELNAIGSRKSALGWRKTCADLRMHLKKKIIDGKDLSAEDVDIAQFYGMKLDGTKDRKDISSVCYDRLSGEQKARMIDLVCENFCFNPSITKLEPLTSDSQSWEEIAEELNTMGTCVKTVSGWKKCWSDIKCDVAKKFENITMPVRLTPGEYKIAMLYNFQNYDYQLGEVRENDKIEITEDEVLHEEHLESMYVDSRVDASGTVAAGNADGYIQEMVEVEFVDRIPKIEDKASNKDQINDEVEEYQANNTDYEMEQPTQSNEVIERLFQEQRRTNDLLEMILEQQRVTAETQSEILNELRNNSFFVMSNPNRTNSSHH